MSSSNCCFLTCIQISQEAHQVTWYSHHFQNFPQFIVIHTVKDFGIVNKAKIDVFLELKMGSIKDINCMDLKEAEDIKKRWQEYSEELYKKDLHDQANYDGVITHLEPDILECEVKWALESITMNNVGWIIEKAREFQKNIYFCFIDYAKAFDYVDPNKLWEILKEMRIPDHLTCLLRNLYADQETTVRTEHGTTDWFQIGKGVYQGCILSPCLFNLYAEYIMRNTGLEEAQAGIKIARRNINNLRYADDTILMAESEEELKSLLMYLKEGSEKVSLNLNI